MFRRPYLYYIAFIVSLSGFLFGYATAIISGPIVLITQEIHLTALQEGFLVGMVLIGAFVGSLGCGQMAERMGRKFALVIAALLFLIGFLLTADARSFAMLLVGRGISGVATGLVSVVVPVYLGEIAPPEARGRYVTSYIFMMTIGILVSYLINKWLILENQWRPNFAYGTIPAALQTVGLFFIPESPQWIEKRSHVEAMPLEKEVVLWRSFFKPPLRTFFLLGLGISLFQQFTGINGIMYYAPKIFSGPGGAVSSHAFIAAIGIGAINCGATLVSFLLIDKLGRRILLLLGLFGIIVSLVFVSICQWVFAPCSLTMTFVGLALFVGFFALSIGPITWVILAEIFPNKIREIGVTFATAINWLSSYIVALTFPLLMEAWHASGTFLFYGGVSLLAYLFILWRVPETKGKTLEQIEALINKQTRKLT